MTSLGHDGFVGVIVVGVCRTDDGNTKFHLFATGALRAAQPAQQAGARSVRRLQHARLFARGATKIVADRDIERLFVADAIPPFRLPEDVRNRKVDVLLVAPVLAEAIIRMHEGQSLSELAAI